MRKNKRVREEEKAQENYSGSLLNLRVNPLPSHPAKEFTMLESLLQAISLHDPLTIFLTYTQERNPLLITTQTPNTFGGR